MPDFLWVRLKRGLLKSQADARRTKKGIDLYAGYRTWRLFERLFEAMKVRMLKTATDPLAHSGIVAPLGHYAVSSSRLTVSRGCWWSLPLCMLALLLTCKVHAQAQPEQ